MHLGEKKKYTVRDYEMLGEGAGYQLIDGDLVPSPPRPVLHQLISGNLFFTITTFLNQTNNRGYLLYAPVDVRFDEDNVFQPDLIFISEDRQHILNEQESGIPDLIIEILSVESGYNDLRYKKDLYEKHGVSEYIVIDPISEDADLYLLENGVYVLDQKAIDNGSLKSIVLLGLTLNLTTIFKYVKS